MRKLMVLAAVVVLGLTVAPTAAHADEVATGCSVGGHNLSAWAYYTPSGATDQWYQFQYQLWGAGTGGKSNVNIWLYENYAQRFSYFSPDNRKQDVFYTLNIAPVSMNASAQEWAKFEAIFDVFWGDPRCTTETAKV